MQHRTADTWTRSELVDHLARLYSLREDMRRADKPVMVHVLTALIKIRTHALRQIDGVLPAARIGLPNAASVPEMTARST